jgi:hypothetical protein
MKLRVCYIYIRAITYIQPITNECGNRRAAGANEIVGLKGNITGTLDNEVRY